MAERIRGGALPAPLVGAGLPGSVAAISRERPRAGQPAPPWPWQLPAGPVEADALARTIGQLRRRA